MFFIHVFKKLHVREINIYFLSPLSKNSRNHAFIFIGLLTFNLIQFRILERAMLTFRNEICQETLSKVYTLRLCARSHGRYRDSDK